MTNDEYSSFGNRLSTLVLSRHLDLNSIDRDHPDPTPRLDDAGGGDAVVAVAIDQARAHRPQVAQDLPERSDQFVLAGRGASFALLGVGESPLTVGQGEMPGDRRPRA